MKKVLFSITVIILIIAFGVSAFLVGNYIVESKRQQALNDKLAQMAATTTTPTTAAPTTTAPAETTAATTIPTEPTEPQILVEYAALYAENPDTVGYIKIPGTKVNYPVVQRPDEKEYYLKRDFYGNKSEWGSIYAWEASNINTPSDNITLFGHHMRDGSMFASLLDYQYQSTWEQRPLITFNTLYEHHTYEIFAVFKTSAVLDEGFPYYRFVDAETEEEFNEYVQTCKDLAFYDTGITPTYGQKLITLSTCEYSLEEGRFVVVAYRLT